jgi:hypothetical protein
LRLLANLGALSFEAGEEPAGEGLAVGVPEEEKS